MNTKAIIPLIAGLVVGGIALKLGADVLRKAQGAQRVATTAVCVAKVPIHRGDLITEEKLDTFEFPEKLIPEWAFTDKELLAGRVARSTIYVGEFVHNDALLPAGTRPGLPVPDGLRAVAVKIDEGSGVDYHLEPGSSVDVIAYFNVRKGGKQSTIARTIIENVEVGAVGERISADIDETDEDGNRTGVRKVRAVTLFVSPKDVPTLALAENQGRIKLSMRGNTIDEALLAKAAPVTGDEVLFGEKPVEEGAEGGGALDKLSDMFAGFFKQPEPVEAEPEVDEPAPQPREPQYVHKMTVYSGNERTVLGWLAFDGSDPVVIEDGGSFGERPRGSSLLDPPSGIAPPTFTPPVPPYKPADVPTVTTLPPQTPNTLPKAPRPTQDDEPNTEDDNQVEPEELLE